jgi:hypothetical protein
MTVLEKIQEKECRVEALRAQIAKLQKDVAILQDASRILADDEQRNTFEGQDGSRNAVA